MVETIYTPISKEDAKIQGLQRYYTDTHCKRGHNAERYVSTGHCVQCAYETADESRKRHPNKFKEWYHSEENHKKAILASVRYVN